MTKKDIKNNLYESYLHTIASFLVALILGPLILLNQNKGGEDILWIPAFALFVAIKRGFDILEYRKQLRNYEAYEARWKNHEEESDG